MSIIKRINQAITNHETFYISIGPVKSLMSLNIEIESKNVESFDNDSIVFYIPQNDINLELFLNDASYEEDDDWVINDGNKFIISFK